MRKHTAFHGKNEICSVHFQIKFKRPVWAWGYCIRNLTEERGGGGGGEQGNFDAPAPAMFQGDGNIRNW